MKHISSSLKAHMQQEMTNLATCWKIARRDGLVLGFTDHDRDIAFDSLMYTAASGFTPTAISSSAGLNVDNLDLEGMLDNEWISEGDLLAGKYDFAAIEIFLVNYADLSQGRMLLRSGWLGEVEWKGRQFVAEMRGLTQQLSSTIGEHYSPGCRVQLGDSRCKVHLPDYTVSGTVSGGGERHQFTDSTREEENAYFSQGKVKFTSGDNTGLEMEVKSYGNGQFILALPMPFAIAAGDAYVAIAGCDKRFTTCAQRYDNALNFRGEPHVPGIDRMLETASTRSR